MWQVLLLVNKSRKMSYQRAEQLFYATSSLGLALAIFLLLPFGFGHVAQFKATVNEQLEKAFIQIIGDQPFLVDDLEIAWLGVNDFYNVSTDEMLVLLTPTKSEDDLFIIANEVSNQFAPVVVRLASLLERVGSVSGESTQNNQLRIPSDKFMQEESLMNIIPGEIFDMNPEPDILEEYMFIEHPVNNNLPWVTLSDNITEELFCVAIYNNEVNKYQGPCKFDYE
jgi:hypothetical protein